MSLPAWWDELSSSTGALDSGDGDLLGIRLSRLARSFSASPAELSERQRSDMFGLLENVLAHGSEADGNAVATEFFEALLAAWDEGFDLEAVWHHVGPESRAYCRAWNEFNGVESPNWM